MGSERVLASLPTVRPTGLDFVRIALIVGTAAALGAIAALQPTIAVGIVGLVIVTALAFLAPVAHLILFVGVTAILPLEIQNQFSLLGGVGSPGLLASDAFLLTGLARTAFVLPGRRLERREAFSAGLAVVVLAVAVGQAVHGVALDRIPSEVAAEFRVILALVGGVLIAMPLVADGVARSRLLKGLLAVGLAAGLWGVLQWGLDLRFGDADKALAGASDRFLTAGRTVGQYGFPVAAVMALAAWTSGQVRTAVGRAALVAVLVLNIVAVVMTFERTFWVVTVLGFAFVLFRSRGKQRARLLAWTPGVLIVLFVALLTLAPAELTAARERLLSIGNYGKDVSVRYRVEESRRVLGEIAERPVLGAGFGATIFIGRPGTTVTPKPRRYAENGYLWLIWKLGVPGTLVLLGLLASAIVRRGYPEEQDGLWVVVRQGAQGGLLTLAVASVTFPSFNALSVTPVMGVLLAVCAAPPVRVLGQRGGASATVSGAVGPPQGGPHPPGIRSSD